MAFPALNEHCNATWLLTDYSEVNGSTALVAGSHKRGRAPTSHEARDVTLFKPITAPAGSILIHSGNVWHGAVPRRVPGLRVSVVMTFCRWYGYMRERFHEHVPPEADVPAMECYSTREKVVADTAAVARIVRDEIGSKPLAYWRARLKTMEGPWAAMQDSVVIGQDPQVRANGYVLPVTDANGVERELVANPVQFDEVPPTIRRAPLFAEDTDKILQELGYSEEAMIDLKVSGAVT